MKTGQVQNVTPIPVRSPEYRSDRTEPILFSPLDPHLLFYAANVLFETKDYGKSWTKISPDLSREHSGQPVSLSPLPSKDVARRRGAIYSLAASSKSLDTLWAGTDDGFVWITRDHGKNWKNITPPQLTAWSKVSQISASHFDDATAYVSVSRLRINDLHPYIYRTHDGGASWQSITSGLPDNSPVDTVREDPVRKGLLFAGTETAVWMSLDDGDHWQPLQYNLPHTSMRDLWISGNDLIVATHGRSFWILDDISALRQMVDFRPANGATLFQPGDAVRVRRSTYTDTPLPNDEPAGENPPDGAAIDYYLPAGIAGDVTLEILDSAGRVVRKYSSGDAPYATEAELAQQLIPLYWLKMPAVLPGGPGMHRWIWDLRYETPTATRYEYPISAVPHKTPRVPQGALALPGSYTVRLTANGKMLSAPLSIKMDPRVAASSAELAQLFALESKLAGVVSSTSEAALEAHSAKEQVERLAKQPHPSAAMKDTLEKVEKQLDLSLEGEQTGNQPQLGLDQAAGGAEALYMQVGQADAAPTAAQQKAAEHAAEVSSTVLAKWQQFTSSSLAELNRQLRSSHLPEVNLEHRPETMPEGGDED